MATPKAKETALQRRARHVDTLTAAGSTQPFSAEAAVRAAVYAVIPGRQKRSAAYMTEALETGMRAAARAIRRTK